jgi:hypothetical protein
MCDFLTANTSCATSGVAGSNLVRGKEESPFIPQAVRKETLRLCSADETQDIAEYAVMLAVILVLVRGAIVWCGCS